VIGIAERGEFHERRIYAAAGWNFTNFDTPGSCMATSYIARRQGPSARHDAQRKCAR
jgi:hypothetical protein